MKHDRGFTLIEILIVLLLVSILTAAIYRTFRDQQKSYMVQEEVVEMQQNLRAGLDIMSREIRMAGYDPAQSGNFGFLTAAATSTSFTIDFDGNGGTPGNDETITYRLVDYDGDGIAAELKRTTTSMDLPIALNIQAIGFAYGFDSDSDGYLDKDGSGNTIWAIDTNADGRLDTNIDTNADGVIDANDNPAGIALTTPVNISTIRAVRLWILARTSRADTRYRDTRTYVVGNQHLTVNDGYRRRLVSIIIKCRNMGLE